MGFLEDKLNWSSKRADGSPRSKLAMFLDPVGACFQPADLHPFQWAVDAVHREREAAAEIKGLGENATSECVIMKDPDADLPIESDQDDEEAKPVITPTVSILPTPPEPVSFTDPKKRENLVASRKQSLLDKEE